MKAPIPLIALYSPWPECGKSSVANLLVDAHRYLRVSFADPMRKMLVTFLVECGLSEQKAWWYLTDSVGKSIPIPEVPGNPTGRHLMRTIGTEWGRDCVTKKLWTGIAQQKIEAARAGVTYDGVVVDDLRFGNEYELMEEMGGLKVNISRLRNKPLNYDNVEERHVSDGGLNDEWFEEVICNDGDSLADIVRIKNRLLARAQGLTAGPDADGWCGPKATRLRADGEVEGCWVRNGEIQWRVIGAAGVAV